MADDDCICSVCAADRAAGRVAMADLEGEAQAKARHEALVSGRPWDLDADPGDAWERAHPHDPERAMGRALDYRATFGIVRPLPHGAYCTCALCHDAHKAASFTYCDHASDHGAWVDAREMTGRDDAPGPDPDSSAYVGYQEVLQGRRPGWRRRLRVWLFGAGF